MFNTFLLATEQTNKANKITPMGSSTSVITHSQWDPARVISASSNPGCIVLNRPIRIPAEVVKQVWQNAALRCVVDGGANRWRRFLDTHCPEGGMKPPDLITGDFDSVTAETFQYFPDHLTKRVHTPDQDATDFTKAVGVVLPLLEEKSEHLKEIIALHDTSGRLDQIMANINTLYKVASDCQHIYLLSGSSLTWLLRPGKHSIVIPQDLLTAQRWCALMPVGEPATAVTTRGLKWNLNNSIMQFGGMVSTSNTYASTLVEIETETCLVWSMGMFTSEEN